MAKPVSGESKFTSYQQGVLQAVVTSRSSSRLRILLGVLVLASFPLSWISPTVSQAAKSAPISIPEPPGPGCDAPPCSEPPGDGGGSPSEPGDSDDPEGPVAPTDEGEAPAATDGETVDASSDTTTIQGQSRPDDTDSEQRPTAFEVLPHVGPESLGWDSIGRLPSRLSEESAQVGEELRRVAIETVQTFAFPLLLVGAIIAFLLFQGWLDRRDPKLALIPVDSSHDFVDFV